MPLRHPTPAGRHITEDVLECYRLHTMEEPEVVKLEEHFLVCEPCRSRYEEVVEYIETIRAGLQELERRPYRPIALDAFCRTKSRRA